MGAPAEVLLPETEQLMLPGKYARQHARCPSKTAVHRRPSVRQEERPVRPTQCNPCAGFDPGCRCVMFDVVMLRLVIAALLLCMLPDPAAAAQRGDVFRHAKAATALVVALDDATRSVSLGSGFFVDADGLLVTNAHVIEDSTRLYLYVRDQAVYTAPEVVAVDPDLDLAALRIRPAGVETLALVSYIPDEATEVVAVGYPRVTDILQMGFALHATVVPGAVSGVAHGRSRTNGHPQPFLQTTGLLNFGNSGGPLVRVDSGEAVGMVVTTVPYLERAKDRSGAAIGSVMMKAGISYSIPAPIIRQWLASKHLESAAMPSQSMVGRPQPSNTAGEADRLFATGHLLQVMAQVLHQDKDFLNLAIHHYEAAAALRPNTPWVLRNLAGTYTSLGRWDMALEFSLKALAQNPNDAELLTNAGLAWQRTGDRDRAAEAYRGALRANPRAAQAHNYLGILLWEMGRLDDAILEFREALDNEPASSVAAYNLGLALEARGDRQVAVNAWESFLQKVPPTSDPDGVRKKIQDAVARLKSTPAAALASTGAMSRSSR